MKSQFVVSFLLAFSGLCLASDLNPCSPGWTGFLPHATNCSLFYICNQGYPNLMRCPENLHFNVEREACLYQEEAGCGQGETPPPGQNTTTTQRPRTTTTRTPEVTTTTTRRPEVTTTTTRRPEVTTTTTRRPEVTTTVPQTTTTRPVTTTTARPGEGGEDGLCPSGIEFIYVAHPSDCNLFILCRHGVNHGVYNCGVGLWFNPGYQVCSTPWGSSCR